MKVQWKWLLCTLLLLTTELSYGAYTFQKGRLVDVCEAATMSAQGHYAAGAEAINSEDWDEAVLHFSIINANFPTTVYGQEAYYYLGTAYYYLEEYDYANWAFTNYLNEQSNPKFFQECIEYKFAIAERLASGAKRRFFGTKQLPKWACGKDLALDIYDEVIVAVPCSEIAAQALVAKGFLFWSNRDYRDAIESFQLLIRRFPKHELAPECYLYISTLYLEQSRFEFQNPDILAFAHINLRRFERDFPSEERLCVAEEDLMAIKEVYASGLYETGLFYERIKRPRAAIIYYHDAIHQFPDTCVAASCRERLDCLDPNYVQFCLEPIIDEKTSDELLLEDEEDDNEEQYESDEKDSTVEENKDEEKDSE